MSARRSWFTRASVLVAAITAASACPAQQVRPDPLETKRIEVPLDLDREPLQYALRDIGQLTDDLVLFGIEIPLDHGNPPLISARVSGGITIRETLQIVFQKLPGFTFVSVAPHLINILPQGYGNDADDMLNLPVAKLDLAGISPSNILSNPVRYIPAVRAALHTGGICEIGPGLSDTAPGISVTAHDTNLLGVLNLVSLDSVAAAENHRGYAWGWVYLRERGSSPSHRWEAHGGWVPGKRRKW
jgi:hypothetical protein